jgi:hypothetical protein
MIRVIVVIREAGKVKPDYSLEFDVPEVPAIGSYISIQRPDKPEPFGEDMIVRHVWWRLKHPETSGFGSDLPKVGQVHEILVECDPATSPWSSDHWNKYLERHVANGDTESFDVARFSISEKDLKQS